MTHSGLCTIPYQRAVSNISSTKKACGNASEADIITGDLESAGEGGNHKALANVSNSSNLKITNDILIITDHNSLGTYVMLVGNHCPERTWSHLRVMEEAYKMSHDNEVDRLST